MEKKKDEMETKKDKDLEQERVEEQDIFEEENEM